MSEISVQLKRKSSDTDVSYSILFFENNVN